MWADVESAIQEGTGFGGYQTSIDPEVVADHLYTLGYRKLEPHILEWAKKVAEQRVKAHEAECYAAASFSLDEVAAANAERQTTDWMETRLATYIIDWLGLAESREESEDNE